MEKTIEMRGYMKNEEIYKEGKVCGKQFAANEILYTLIDDERESFTMGELYEIINTIRVRYLNEEATKIVELKVDKDCNIERHITDMKKDGYSFVSCEPIEEITVKVVGRKITFKLIEKRM